MSKKRVIILILILIVLAAIGFAVYYFYFKKPAPTPEIAPETTPTTQQTPGGVTIINDRLNKISADAAVSPVASPDGQRVFYLGKKGNIYETGFNGANPRETPLVLQPNPLSVSWSPSRGELAIAYGEPSGKKWFYYDTKTKETVPYKENIKSLAFSKAKNEIVYHLADDLTGGNSIQVADANGANPKTIFSTRIRDIRAEWAAENKAAVSSVPSGLAASILWLIDANTQKALPILQQIYGLTVKWSPSGEKFIFSQTSNQGNNLSLFSSNQNGTSVKNLGVATLPEKCAWSGDEKSMICAVPKTAPDIVWPDDYYKRLYASPEQIWRINPETGKKDLLYEFGEELDIDASDLLLSPKEDFLVFINRKDENLYSLKIK